VAIDRCATRRDELVSILEQEGLDGLIVTHLPNIRYLTGFSGSSAALAVTKADSVMVTDPRYRTQVTAEVGDSIRIEVVSSDIWGRMWESLSEVVGIEVLGYECHAVSALRANEFADSPFADRLRSAEPLVERLRVSKGAEEVSSIKDAAHLASEALDRTLLQVKAGLTELEVAGLLERELRVGGSEWHPFPTIVASGPRSALPHAETSSREIQAGEFLLLDFGAQVDGYCSDISRTVVVGRRANPRQQEMYELVQRVQRIAREGVRAGMSGRDADALARAPIEDAGLGEAFEHSLGHGLGLEVHEEPRLSKLNEEALPVGAVVTIEPGVYLPDWGGIRIEDDVYLTEEGPVLLSDGATELRETT
jgi:Xaa-Pro aminopeptidase